MDLLSTAARSTRSRGRLSPAFFPAGESLTPHGRGIRSASPVIHPTGAAFSICDLRLPISDRNSQIENRNSFDAFATGFLHAVVIGCVAMLIIVLGTGCQTPAATSPGLEAAGANAATLDGTLDTIGYHAEQLRKEFK